MLTLVALRITSIARHVAVQLRRNARACERFNFLVNSLFHGEGRDRHFPLSLSLSLYIVLILLFCLAAETRCIFLDLSVNVLFCIYTSKY